MSDASSAERAGGAHPPTRDIPLSSGQRWRAYWVAVAVAAITILDISKVNVALPSIEDAFNAASTELQLIVSGYILTFGLVLVPAGRIGDQRSRRVLFLVGLSLFLVTSAACALAPNSTVLLIARLLQGVAAGIQMPQVLGLIQQLFHGAERGKAFGLFGATVGIATAFGPTLGGLLIALGGDRDGWRLIFWINVPLSLIVIACAAWLLPATRTKSRRKLQLDPVGVLLFALSVGSVMWPFLFTTGSPDDDPLRWLLLVVFAVFFAAFVLWERHYAASGRVPLVPFAIFTIASYRNGALLSLSYFAALPTLFILTTLYLQSGIGLAPLYAGMVTIGFAVGSAVTSWIGGSLVARLGRPLVVWGLAGLLVSVGALVVVALILPPESVAWAMAACMTFAGLSSGFVLAPNQTLMLAEIPVTQGGLAGSVSQLGQRIGTAVGTAVGLALFYATIFRESGRSPDLVVFHDAFGYGMIAVGAFLGLAFIVGVVDLVGRRARSKRQGRAEPQTP